MSILFLGESYRADAQTWIKGVEKVSSSKIKILEVASSSSRIIRLLNFVFFFVKIIIINLKKSESFDIVLAERSTSYGFFSLFVKTKKRVVAQQGITDIYPLTRVSVFYKSILKNVVYRNVDLIHAWGEVMVPAMLENSASMDKIIILPKGLDLSVYKFQSPENKISTNAIVTRSLFPLYRHKDIFDAIYILKLKNIIVNLTVVGDGDLFRFLVEYSNNLGLQNQIYFTGRIPNSEVSKLLRESAIYFSTPETEGVSASLFEAMASGCFPIVTNLPGTKVFIEHGKNGFLIPVNNSLEISSAIELFLIKPEIFYSGIKKNREFIESNVDLDKNMQIIYNKYLSLFN